MRFRRPTPPRLRRVPLLLLTALVFGLQAQNVASPGPNTFVLARNGQAFLYDEEAGLEAVPFLSGVYKSFGFSPDLKQFLYLKADGEFPTFALYSYNLTTRTVRRITDAAVHHAAWSPDGSSLAYIWADTAGLFHVSTYDLTSGIPTEIASGQLSVEFLDWSPDGRELLYMRLTGLTRRAAEDGHYARTVHRYSLAGRTESAIPDADWAQFSGGELVVASRTSSQRQRAIPNPQAEDIQRFAIAGGRTYAQVSENGRPTVKRWNAAARTFESIQRGQIFLATSRGVVIRNFTAAGAAYDYVSATGVRRLATASTGFQWKIPFQGQASVVQGGALYTDGSCDGALCFITAHGGALGYAIDWQQIRENRDGNTHVLAAGDGTVAAAANNVTCNTASSTCSVGWDDYNPSCASNGGVGNYVTIAHLDGSYSLYGHLKSGSVQVVPGEQVLQGTYLADQGHSGAAGTYNNYLGCGDHLHFSRQVGPGIWDQSIPTDFVETPCAMGCPAAYTSTNVELAPAPTLTAATPAAWTPGATVPVTLTGRNFVYGSTVAVAGSGISISDVTVLSPTRVVATFVISPTAAPGSYNITVTSANGTSGSLPFTIAAQASGGTLAGALSTPSGVQNLTATGASDWTHWGLATPQSFNHKAGVVSQIGDYAPIGSVAQARYTGAAIGFSWSDGTPTATATNVAAGVTVSGQNNGFSITTPADTTARTLSIYVSVTGSQGSFTARLSDGSAPDFIDTSLTSGSGETPAIYTLTYRAASPGQTLVVTFTQTSSGGNVSLQAAALTGGSVSPDWSISSSPVALPLLPGAVATANVATAALSGFSGNVALSVAGVPAGVSASFQPASVAAGGTATLTLTAGPTVATGTYPLTISGVNSAVTRTSSLTLVVGDFSPSITPAARTAMAGGTVTYTVTAAAPLDSSAPLALTATGLPSGAVASFNPGTVVPGGSSVLTITIPSGTAAGTYSVSITASTGGATRSSTVGLTVVAPATGGALAGSITSPSGTAQLTTDGTLDWVHWGLSTASSVDRKAGISPQISDLTILGGAANRYANNAIGFTWTDGTPTASVTSSTTGIYAIGIGKGFSITAPADRTVRKLKVYVGAYLAQARMVARLSDGSAPDYVDSTLNNTAAPTTVGVYTLTYTAASAGQTLTVTFTQITESANGNVTIQAASLAGAPDFTVGVTPGTQSVVAGAATSYTATVSPLNGFSDVVTLSVTGLPSGATGSFNPASVTGGGSSTLTVTTTAATAPGSYPLTLSGVDGGLTHTASFTLTVTQPAAGGTLTGSMATPTGTAQLTTEGSLDWAHWGLNTAMDFDRKAGVTAQISNFSLAASGTPSRYANNAIGFTWTDGTPTVSATNTTTGVYISGQNNGFRLTIPADTSTRVLRVYVGAWRTQGRMLAHLSDGSAADFVDTSLTNSAGVTTLGVYTLSFAAASAGQTLTVTYTQNTATAGNVTLQAATLSGSIPPDFSVTATPSSQSAAAGSSATYTVNTAVTGGFNSNIALAATGLPAGVVATFAPSTVAAGASSTLTLSISGSVAAGSYPFAVTGTSGGVTRTANATLLVTDFTVSATPSSQSVTAGGSGVYTVTLTAQNGFSGTIGLTASGLPAGVTASFNPPTVTGGGTSSMTLTVASGATAGSYPVTITASSGAATHTASVTLVVTAVVTGGGTLAGSMATPTGTIQLTTEGTADWTHWGLNTATDFDRKAGVAAQLSNFTAVGGGTPARYGNNAVGFTWTDGTPTATATATTTGIFISGQAQGFQITAPADTTARTLRVYVGAWRAQGRFVAHLSDGSAADYSDGSLTNNSGVTTLGVYTVTYAAASAGQTLTATFTQETPTVSGVTGNVTLQAATLASSGGPADFGVTASPSTQSVVAGGSAPYTVTVNPSNGFTGTVTLSVSGLPTGVTGSFNPSTVAGSGSSTLTLTVPSGTAPGTYPATITATSGSLTHTASVSLTVTDFSVTATPASQSVAPGGNAVYTATIAPLNGFAGDVSLSISGLPSGVTAAFAPSTVTAGSGSSTLTLTVGSGAAVGSYPLTITGASGGITRTTSVTLAVTAAPDFSVSATPSSGSAVAGGSASYTVNVSAVNGFTGNVALSISGAPAGVTAAFAPSTVTGGAGASTLTVSAASGTAAGSYTLTITGASGALTHTATATFAVTDFTIAATPQTRTAAVGGSAAYSLAITPLFGFNGDVALTISGLPSGVTATFSPTTVTGGNGTSALTLAISGTATAGSYPLTVTGTSGGLSHTAAITLTVTDFSISITPASQNAITGGNAVYTVTVAAQNGFSGTVGFAVTGLPAGVTAAFSPTTVTGSGSTTMTVTVPAGTAAGTNPFTVTASSGALSHTASATLAVTDFAVSVAPSSQSAVVGDSPAYTVSVTAQNGFSGTVALSAGGLPAGVTASFNPSSVTAGGTSTMTLTVGSGTVAGSYPVTITAQSGGVTHTATATLLVADFSVSATPSSGSTVAGGSASYTVNVNALNGFTGNVALSVSGAPAGVTAAFAPSTVTGGTGSSTLTVSAASGTAAGSYTLTITGASGALTHTATVTFAVADFTIAATPQTRTAAVGGSAAYSLAITPLFGFNGDVALTISGLPSGVTATFSPTTVTGGNGTSALTLAIAGTVAAGSYPLTVTGTSGGLSHTAAITLTVTDFSLSITPASQNAIAGGNAVYTVTVAAQNGFSGTVGFAVTGLPAGVTAAFSPTTVTGSGSSTMTVTIPAGTAVGTYQFTVTASSGTLSRTASATLLLTDFAVSPTPSSQSAVVGGSATYTVNVTAQNGFNGTVTLGAAGLPAGVAAAFSPATVTGSGASTLTLTIAGGTAPGTYPFTISAASGGVTHTANATLVITDFTVSATPPSQSVTAGGSAVYTVTLTAQNGFSGTIGLSASGLPAGVTASFNPATVTGGGTSTMTLTVASGTTTGSYPVTITASSGNATHTASVTLGVTMVVTGGGTLSGSAGTPTGTIQLTTEGSADWTHWGLNTATDFDRKAGVTAQLSNYTSVLGGTPAQYANNGVGFTWTDGTPTATATASTTGIFLAGQGQGFRITAPADTTVRTLRVYVGAWRAQARFVAHLSDNSAADYSDGTLTNNSGVTTLGVYTLTYAAASAGQTLTVTFTQEMPTVSGLTGNVTLQAATLAGGSAPADFGVTASPSTQSVVAGGSASYTVTVNPLNGFTGTVGLSVTGLPAGVTASFNPPTVTASGSSTLTLTAASGTTAGTYPLTITATSGSLTHTAPVSVTVTAPQIGTLNGSLTAPSGPIQLTTEGSSDWAHWGNTTATDFDHKAAVTQQISNFVSIAGAAPSRYSNNSVGFTWTDGTPTASANNSKTGVYVSGQGQGFRITVPAGTSSRTLRVYVGAWRTQGRMVAHLSDGSAADFVDTSLTNSTGVTTVGVYTLTFKAASAGQTLTVSFTQNTATSGNVTIQAATLQ